MMNESRLWVLTWVSFGAPHCVDLWLPRRDAYRAAVGRCMQRPPIVAALAVVTLSVTLGACSALAGFDRYTFDGVDGSATSDAAMVGEDASDARAVDPLDDAGGGLLDASALDAGGGLLDAAALDVGTPGHDASALDAGGGLLDAAALDVGTPGHDAGPPMCCGTGCPGCSFRRCPLLNGAGWVCSVSGTSCGACP